MEDDVGDSVRFVDYGDVIDCFGSRETHEPDDSCVWFEAREVQLFAVGIEN